MKSRMYVIRRLVLKNALVTGHVCATCLNTLFVCVLVYVAKFYASFVSADDFGDVLYKKYACSVADRFGEDGDCVNACRAAV